MVSPKYYGAHEIRRWNMGERWGFAEDGVATKFKACPWNLQKLTAD
jgi:hypothetical protein